MKRRGPSFDRDESGSELLTGSISSAYLPDASRVGPLSQVETEEQTCCCDATDQETEDCIQTVEC